MDRLSEFSVPQTRMVRIITNGENGASVGLNLSSQLKIKSQCLKSKSRGALAAEEPKKTPRHGGRGVHDFVPFTPPTLARVFACWSVLDLELFHVHREVSAEAQLAEVTLFHLDEMSLVLGAEAFEHGGMHHDAELEVRIVAGCAFQDFRNLR